MEMFTSESDPRRELAYCRTFLGYWSVRIAIQQRNTAFVEKQTQRCDRQGVLPGDPVRIIKDSGRLFSQSERPGEHEARFKDVGPVALAQAGDERVALGKQGE